MAKIAVAPLVGAWIEIIFPGYPGKSKTVAPLVGAWIEMFVEKVRQLKIARRSPRGSVD